MNNECASRQIDNALKALRHAQHKTALAIYAMERAYQQCDDGDKRLKSAITKWQHCVDKQKAAEQRHYFALVTYSDFVRR